MLLFFVQSTPYGAVNILYVHTITPHRTRHSRQISSSRSLSLDRPTISRSNRRISWPRQRNGGSTNHLSCGGHSWHGCRNHRSRRWNGCRSGSWRGLYRCLSRQRSRRGSRRWFHGSRGGKRCGCRGDCGSRSRGVCAVSHRDVENVEIEEVHLCISRNNSLWLEIFVFALWRVLAHATS